MYMYNYIYTHKGENHTQGKKNNNFACAYIRSFEGKQIVCFASSFGFPDYTKHLLGPVGGALAPALGFAG